MKSRIPKTRWLSPNRSLVPGVSLILVLLSGCASLPTDYPRPESKALEDYRSTSLGQRFAALEETHSGESGFALLRYGRKAFSARLALIDSAEKTIDLQVYIWEVDETGLVLAERLVQAADRGVRVRVLVDDMGFGGTDEGMGAVDSHPNIEVRVFNPFANRDNSMWDFLFDLDRVNHRMHNKLLVGDNSFAVVGGRNIGNHYFGTDPDTNFRDLDIIAAGPVVRDISKVFDHFWAGEVAVPASALVGRTFSEEDMNNRIKGMRDRINNSAHPFLVEKEREATFADPGFVEGLLIWAPGMIVWNSPEKSMDDDQEAEMITAFRRKVSKLERSLTIESAYFVVGDRGLATAKALMDRGVKVRILTNSLASNDVLAAHAGHAKFREALLEAGAELYELRSDSGKIEKSWRGESRAGLHTKALAFDDESLFVGSFNLDPRSAKINTEAGLYVKSPELTAQLLAYMAEGIAPENSYKVTLDEDGDLLWTTRIDGQEVTYDKEPLSTFGQRFTSGFIQMLPVESQL
jgi:putative cardiolipin synthase